MIINENEIYQPVFIFGSEQQLNHRTQLKWWSLLAIFFFFLEEKSFVPSD